MARCDGMMTVKQSMSRCVGMMTKHRHEELSSPNSDFLILVTCLDFFVFTFELLLDAKGLVAESSLGLFRRLGRDAQLVH